jgi:hypothetical protein
MKKIIAALIGFLFCVSVFSQDMLGVLNSNNAGIYNIGVNPSSMTTSKLYMDYNLFSMNLAFETNYIYIENSDFKNWIYKRITPAYFTSERESRSFTIYRDGGSKKGFVNLKIQGPAAMINYGKHSFGASLSFKSHSTFTNLPQEMANFLYEAIDYDVQHNIDYSHTTPIKMGSLSYTEISLSYAYIFKRYKWDFWSAGISVKPLLGNAGFYSNLNTVDYMVQSDDTAYIYNADFVYAYTAPINYDDNGFPEGPLIRGFGVALDLGITYQYTTKGHQNNVVNSLCDQRYEDYNIRVGFSLLDLGFVNFNKKSERREYIAASADWYEVADTLPTGTMNEINTKVDHYFGSTASKVTKEDNFKIYTAPAASLQIDYHWKREYFLNATVIYGFNLGEAYIKRPSIIAFTPRYETNRFEVSLPISIYEWKFGKPRVGVMIRFGNFFIGSDKLNSIVGFADFTGMDFYAGLRLNLSRVLGMNYFKGNCGNSDPRDIEMFDYRNF